MDPKQIPYNLKVVYCGCLFCLYCNGTTAKVEVWTKFTDKNHIMKMFFQDCKTRSTSSSWLNVVSPIVDCTELVRWSYCIKIKNCPTMKATNLRTPNETGYAADCRLWSRSNIDTVTGSSDSWFTTKRSKCCRRCFPICIANFRPFRPRQTPWLGFPSTPGKIFTSTMAE